MIWWDSAQIYIITSQNYRQKSYSGELPWDTYLCHFDAVAVRNDWSYAEKGRNLMVCLEGAALDVAMGMPADLRYDYNSLKDCLLYTSPSPRD